MNKRTMFLGILFLLILSCKNSDVTNEQIPKEKEKIKKVLIIGMDGCRPDALTAANTPSLDALMANATYSLDARNLTITSSGPSWSSMLTGVWEDKHGITNNSFSGANFEVYPHFFKRVEDFDSNYRTVSVCQWDPINDFLAEQVADVVWNTGSGTETKEKAVSELSNPDLTALFVHFDDIDGAGHSYGYSSEIPNYLSAIEGVDSEIGDLMAALKNRKYYDDENWVIIVSTDHGGKGRSHGGNSDEERTIFVIASGDAIPNEKIAKTTSETTVPPANNCLNSTSELYFEKDAIIEVANNTAHSFGDAQDFSIECRVRSTSPNDVSIVSKKDWYSGSLPGYVFSFNPNEKKFKVNVGDGTNRIDVNASVITDNEWHTLSATFDRDGDLSVYVDGVLKNSISMATIGNIDNAFPFTIGADGNNAYKYDGHIAEVRVFNTLLSEDDIDTWKCNVLDNTHPKYGNLQGHWKLTEGTGTTITDSSPIGADGILSGGIWEDATISKTVIVSNYENTPRTIDVVKTALNHLCIPIQASWKIEGNSLIDMRCSN